MLCDPKGPEDIRPALSAPQDTTKIHYVLIDDWSTLNVNYVLIKDLVEAMSAPEDKQYSDRRSCGSEERTEDKQCSDRRSCGSDERTEDKQCSDRRSCGSEEPFEDKQVLMKDLVKARNASKITMF